MVETTDHYELTKYMRLIHHHNREVRKGLRAGERYKRLPYCIECHRVLNQVGQWVDYGDLPEYVLDDDITGTACPECMTLHYTKKALVYKGANGDG